MSKMPVRNFSSKTVSKPTGSLFGKYAVYKTYFIVGCLVAVSTIVLGTLGGVGVFDSSSNNDESVGVVQSSSGTVTAPPASSTAVALSSTGSQSSTALFSSSSSSSSGFPTPSYQFLASSFLSSGTADNTPISSWVGTDSGDVAVQSTSTKQPLFKAAGMSGFPSVYFDGGDALTGLNVFPTNTPYSIVTVINHACTINFCNIFSSSVNNPGSHSLGLGPTSAPKVTILHNDQFFNQPTVTAPANAPIVIAITYSNTELKIYQNGAQVMTQTHTGSNPVLDSSICIGCTSNANDYMFIGHISVVEGYNSVVDVVARSLALKTAFNIA